MRSIVFARLPQLVTAVPPLVPTILTPKNAEKVQLQETLELRVEFVQNSNQFT